MFSNAGQVLIDFLKTTRKHYVKYDAAAHDWNDIATQINLHAKRVPNAAWYIALHAAINPAQGAAPH